MTQTFKRLESTAHEMYMAKFSGVTCTVTRAQDGAWWWSANGIVFYENGQCRTKRWAMSKALARVTKIQKMKFKSATAAS